MGTLLDILRGIIARLFGGNTSNFLNAVSGMLQQGQGGSGGLAAIIAGFQQKGLGHLADSWVGTGPNADVTPDQLKEGLGEDRIANLIAKTGLSEADLLGKLKQYLPAMVDKMTPDGKLPE